MFPQPMSWSEPLEDESNPLAQPDLVEALQRQIASGFPPGLALDLVLNELVVRAATATRARAAALALKRDDEMVCRAATGEHAPDLGIPLNTRDGLSGACLRTHQSQLCLDTETDPRVDPVASRRLGIRSMLVVPVLEGEEMVGVLEVFGTDPGEFVDSDQNLLEIFARDVARIRRASYELEHRPFSTERASVASSALDSSIESPSLLRQLPDPRIDRRAPYEIWTLVLGGVAILLAVTISFVIGSRIGWLGFSSPRVQSQPSPATLTANPVHATPAAKAPAETPNPVRPATGGKSGGLVVYEQGKVVFRMQPVLPGETGVKRPPQIAATPGGIARVWLAADLAESRLRQRSEPQYPADALAAHRAGDVVLEIVVDADGAIESTRVVSGDPLLANAASEAVRNWRYEPYRVQGRPAEFQTDVTLKFSLPD